MDGVVEAIKTDKRVQAGIAFGIFILVVLLILWQTGHLERMVRKPYDASLEALASGRFLRRDRMDDRPILNQTASVLMMDTVHAQPAHGQQGTNEPEDAFRAGGKSRFSAARRSRMLNSRGDGPYLAISNKELQNYMADHGVASQATERLSDTSAAAIAAGLDADLEESMHGRR